MLKKRCVLKSNMQRLLYIESLFSQAKLHSRVLTPGVDFKNTALKVHKIENSFGFDFEFYTVSLLVMLKYEGFVTNNF